MIVVLTSNRAGHSFVLGSDVGGTRFRCLDEAVEWVQGALNTQSEYRRLFGERESDQLTYTIVEVD